MTTSQKWYIVKQKAGHCEILPIEPVEGENQDLEGIETWGPFASQAEAIARRVGLIRAGKCKPV